MSTVARTLRSAESPIEYDLMAALMSLAGDRIVLVGPENADQITKWAAARENKDKIYVSTQVPLGRFRADMVVGGYKPYDKANVFCVECDGWAYHRQNLKQVMRDLSRDDEIEERFGFKTIRLRGYAIYKDPFSCAYQVLSDFGIKPKLGFAHALARFPAVPDHDAIDKRSLDEAHSRSFSFWGDDQ